jgi:hypothetical protein
MEYRLLFAVAEIRLVSSNLGYHFIRQLNFMRNIGEGGDWLTLGIGDRD